MSYINPCRICKTDAYLQAKWHSGDKVKWVHCDSCGNQSTPTSDNPVDQWNSENKEK